MNSLAQAPTKTVPTPPTESLGRRMLNKVPEITVYFWVIKVLCTTVGETFADNLNENLGLGLSGTSYIMGTLLIARARLPVPREEVRARDLLARGRPDQRRRHPGQRQPGRKLRRHTAKRRRSRSARS